MLIDTSQKIERRLRHFENLDHEALMKAWKAKGSHKGDTLWRIINERFGEGDFSVSDHGDLPETNNE